MAKDAGTAVSPGENTRQRQPRRGVRTRQVSDRSFRATPDAPACRGVCLASAGMPFVRPRRPSLVLHVRQAQRGGDDGRRGGAAWIQPRPPPCDVCVPQATDRRWIMVLVDNIHSLARPWQRASRLGRIAAYAGAIALNLALLMLVSLPMQGGPPLALPQGRGPVIRESCPRRRSRPSCRSATRADRTPQSPWNTRARRCRRHRSMCRSWSPTAARPSSSRRHVAGRHDAARSPGRSPA